MRQEIVERLEVWEREGYVLSEIAVTFQELIDSGEVWNDPNILYADVAVALIGAGYCHRVKLKVVE